MNIIIIGYHISKVGGAEMIYDLNEDGGLLLEGHLKRQKFTTKKKAYDTGTVGDVKSIFNKQDIDKGKHTRVEHTESSMTLGYRNAGLEIRHSAIKKPTSIDNDNIRLDEYPSFNQHQASNLLAKRGGGSGAHKVCRKKPTTITKCMDRIVYGRKVRFCVYKKAFRCTSVDRFRSLFMIVV